MGALNEVTPERTIRNVERVGNQYKDVLIRESAATFDSEYSKKYPLLGELFAEEDQKEQMRAALTIKMVEQTKAYMDRMSEINEAVTQQSLGRLNRKVLDVVRIFYPNLIAHELVDIQTLPGQTGDVFTVRPRFGKTDGLTWVDADGAEVDTPEIFKHRVKDGDLPSYTVQGEGTGGGDRDQIHNLTYAVSAATASYGVVPGAGSQVGPSSGDDEYLPILPGSFTLRFGDDGAVLTVSDNGSGALLRVSGTVSDSDYGTGFVNYATGEVYVNRDSGTFAADVAVTATFNSAGWREMDSDMAGGAVNANILPRRVEINIAHQNVKAQMYPLQVDWTVGASLAAKQHLGIDVNDTVAQLAAHYIKWERDALLTYAIRNQTRLPMTAQGTYTAWTGTAGNVDVLFNCQGNATNYELSRRNRFADFSITIDEAESMIQRRNGRGRVDWVLVGNNVANVIRRLPDFQERMVDAPIGAHVIGTLRNGRIVVVKDIHMPVNHFVCGYKGYMAGDAAIILAEWIPIYFTPPHQSATLTTSQGIMSAYDLVPNVTDYLIGGAITNYNS